MLEVVKITICVQTIVLPSEIASAFLETHPCLEMSIKTDPIKTETLKQCLRWCFDQLFSLSPTYP